MVSTYSSGLIVSQIQFQKCLKKILEKIAMIASWADGGHLITGGLRPQTRNPTPFHNVGFRLGTVKKDRHG